MRWSSASARETRAIAKKILSRYCAFGPRPLILALSGNLGSGKTVFAEGVAEALGVRVKVQSPTFVLMKWYDLPRIRSEPKSRRARSRGLNQPSHGPRFLVHIDAYRIERARALAPLGIREMFRDRDAIIVIEWAEKIRSLIPKTAVWITFRHSGTAKRTITVQNYRGSTHYEFQRITNMHRRIRNANTIRNS